MPILLTRSAFREAVLALWCPWCNGNTTGCGPGEYEFNPRRTPLCQSQPLGLGKTNLQILGVGGVSSVWPEQ